MIRFYVPHLGHSGGVAQILRTASGLLKRGHDVVVCDLSERCHTPEWFDGAIPIVAPGGKSDVDVMFEAGPGHLAAGKRILFRMNTRVWDAAQENKNLSAEWDGFLCVSRSLCADSTRRHPNIPVAYAPPGIDPLLIPGEPVTEPVVGLLAHTAPFKRTLEALQMLHPLKADGLRILAYGPANHPLIDEHFGRPTFAELGGIYRRCALWLMPSSSEGFPLPPLEAAACGAVPIVADDREYDFKGGLDVPLEMFPQTVASLIINTPRRLELRNAALAAAKEYRSWDRTVDAMESLL